MSAEDPQPLSPVAARLRVVAAALLFSTGGAAIKAVSLGGWQVAGIRSGIAALAILAMVPGARRAVTWRSWLVGVPYALTLVLFVLANKLTTSANAIFLQSTAPLYLVLLAPLLLKEKPRARELAFMGALACGLAMFFVAAPAAVASAPRPFEGNLVAAGSGLAWAFTLLGLRWSGRDGTPGAGGAAIVAGNALALAICLPLMLPLGSARASDWLLLVYLGVIQIGLAYVLLTRALSVVPAFEAALLLLVEPTVNPFFAWWFQGEKPSGWSLAGSLTILGATAVKSWLDAREARRMLARANIAP